MHVIVGWGESLLPIKSLSFIAEATASHACSPGTCDWEYIRRYFCVCSHCVNCPGNGLIYHGDYSPESVVWSIILITQWAAGRDTHFRSPGIHPTVGQISWHLLSLALLTLWLRWWYGEIMAMSKSIICEPLARYHCPHPTVQHRNYMCMFIHKSQILLYILLWYRTSEEITK